jgi:hypothetical protein
MTLPELLEILKARKLEVFVNADGEPALRGDPSQATHALMKVVARLKAELIEHFRPKVREWLWPGGHRYIESEGDGYLGNPDRHPTGSRWWRLLTEKGWKPVPRRETDRLFPIPEGEVLA